MEKRLEKLFEYMNDEKEKLEGLHAEIKEVNEQKNKIDDKDSFFYNNLDKKYQEKLNDYSMKQQNIKSHVEKEKNEIENLLKEELKDISGIEESHQQKAKEAKELREYIDGKKSQLSYLKNSLDSSDKNSELIKNEEQLISDLEDKLNITYTELRNLTAKKEKLIPEGEKPEEIYLQKQAILKSVNGLTMSNIDETKENISRLENKSEEKVNEEPVNAEPENKEPVNAELGKKEPINAKSVKSVKVKTVVEEPIIAEPENEEPIIAEPKNEEPIIAEPKNEEPANNTINWHPKLTDEQIEELLEQGIEPGDNEYNQYLWEHNINPFESVSNTKSELEDEEEIKSNTEETEDLFEQENDEIEESVEQEYDEPEERYTPDDNVLRRVKIDPLSQTIRGEYAVYANNIMQFQPEINYNPNDCEQIIKLLKEDNKDISDIQDLIDTNVISYIYGIKCKNRDERLNEYFDALRGKKTNLKVGYDLRGIYKSDFTREEIKNIIRIAKNSKKANKNLVHIKQDNILRRIAGKIERDLEELNPKNSVKKIGNNVINSLYTNKNSVKEINEEQELGTRREIIDYANKVLEETDSNKRTFQRDLMRDVHVNEEEAVKKTEEIVQGSGKVIETKSIVEDENTK